MRSTPGCAVSAAPASSPIPCTTLNAPSGRPASRAMSASIDAVSGAHSGGLRTTVLPAASAGATPPGGEHQRRVPRRDDRGDAGRIPRDVLGVAVACRVVVARASSSWSAKKRKLRATRGMTEFAASNGAASRCRASRPRRARATRASTPSATRCRTAARSFGGIAPQTGERLARGGDGRVDLGGAAAGDLGDRRLVDRRDVDEGRRPTRRDRRRSSARWRPRRPRRRRARGDPLLASWDAMRPKVVRTRTVWPLPSCCQAAGNRFAYSRRPRANDERGSDASRTDPHQRWR